MNRLTRYRRAQVHGKSQAGQALVEMAFIVPILVLLLIGVIEIGRYAYIAILVGNAARAGAAYATTPGVIVQRTNDPNVATAAQNDFQSNGMAGLSVTSFTTCGCDVGGTISSDTQGNCAPTGSPPTCPGGHWVVTMHVTASGTFNGLFNFLGAASQDISRTAIMRAP